MKEDEVKFTERYKNGEDFIHTDNHEPEKIEVLNEDQINQAKERVKLRVSRVQSAKKWESIDEKALKSYESISKVWEKHKLWIVKTLRKNEDETIYSRIEQHWKKVEERTLVDILSKDIHKDPLGPVGAWISNLRRAEGAPAEPNFIQIGPISNNDYLPIY